MLRVSVTCTPVCGRAGTSAGSLPMRRKGLPSMRIRLASGCSLRVQCRVVSSVRRSAIDQTLKFGLMAINGTAGGRNGASPEFAHLALAIKIATIITRPNCFIGIVLSGFLFEGSLLCAMPKSNRIRLHTLGAGEREQPRAESPCYCFLTLHL